MTTDPDVPAEPPRMLEQRLERRYSAHNDLLRFARDELQLTGEDMPGWWNHAFVSLICSALAIEALGNAVGERIVPGWKDDYETMSPYAKLRFVAERLEVPYSPGAEPWQTLRWLSRFRNTVAHAKPESLSSRKIITQEKTDAVQRDAPESRLEALVTADHARKAYAAVDDLRLALWQGMGRDVDGSGILSDSWSGTTSVFVPPGTT